MAHQPSRGSRDEILIIEPFGINAVGLEGGDQVAVHRVVPVGGDAGTNVFLLRLCIAPPGRVAANGFGVGVERKVDHLELEVIFAPGQDSRILVVVVQAFDVDRRHDFDDRPNRVGELQAPLRVAVGYAVARGAEFPGVGEVLVRLLKV